MHNITEVQSPHLQEDNALLKRKGRKPSRKELVLYVFMALLHSVLITKSRERESKHHRSFPKPPLLSLCFSQERDGRVNMSRSFFVPPHISLLPPSSPLPFFPKEKKQIIASPSSFLHTSPTKFLSVSQDGKSKIVEEGCCAIEKRKKRAAITL